MVQLVEIECVVCSHMFTALEGGEYESNLMCAKCWMDTWDWYRCPGCKSTVSTRPCFICERRKEKDA